MKFIGKLIVVELLEEKPRTYVCPATYGEGYNDALDEVVRMNPAWEVSQDGIENVIEGWLSCGESRLTPDDVKEIAQALAANPSAWLKRKDSDEAKAE